MATYAQALLIAIPFFMVLILIELLYATKKNKQTYSTIDTIASLSSGVSNSIKNLLGLGVLLISYPYLLEQLSIVKLDNQWWVWMVAFIFIDFAGYWSHRISHNINLFWNNHIIHHSSEHFNLACALRQPISDVIRYYPLLLLPAAILGVPEQLIAYIAPLHLFLQFWYHTEHIGKLGWLEYVFITPSQHRVHHAINAPYIDKNLGQIFSFWDRLFGTFQEELDDEPPRYGVLKAVQTWNPIRINFLHLIQLITDAYRTSSYWDKLRIWFMPTGWRPVDVTDAYPIEYIEDIHGFERYDTKPSIFFQYYAILQLVAILGLFILMLRGYTQLSHVELIFFSVYLGTTIYGYSDLFDLKYSGYVIELIRSCFGLWFLTLLNHWSGLQAVLDPFKGLIALYLMLTLLGSMYIVAVEFKKTKA